MEAVAVISRPAWITESGEGGGGRGEEEANKILYRLS